jgi:hypothetical protein
MPELDPRIAKLRATRADYDAELQWHKFLLDAINSTGGFRGRVGPTEVSFLGWAAEAYAATNIPSAPVKDTWIGGPGECTYLDQFPREDREKFAKRRDIAHYVNYTGPILKTLLAYITNEPTNRDGVSEDLKVWMADVDGKKTTWDQMLRTTIWRRAGGMGWCPVLFDAPEAPQDEEAISAARAEALGLGRVKAIPLFPMNLLDWAEDEDGTLKSVKIRTCLEVREDLLADGLTEEHYAIWDREKVRKFVVTVPKEGDPAITSEREVSHSFGCVPVVVFHAEPDGEDCIRGASVVGDVAVVNRRIFNLDSELDDHGRNSCFSILGIPVKDMDSDVGEIVGGSGSAMKIPHDASQKLHTVAPPESVPAAMEKRREVLVREIYRCGRLEYAKPTGVTTSGIARAYEFEGTNRRLGDIAGAFARGDQDSLRLVERMRTGNKDSKVTVSPPADFSVEDLTADLQNLVSALALGLGATANSELKKRASRRLLPNLPSATMTAIEAEIDDLATQKEQDDAMAREVEKAAQQAQLDNPGGVPGEGEPGEAE